MVGAWADIHAVYKVSPRVQYSQITPHCELVSMTKPRWYSEAARSGGEKGGEGCSWRKEGRKGKRWRDGGNSEY